MRTREAKTKTATKDQKSNTPFEIKKKCIACGIEKGLGEFATHELRAKLPGTSKRCKKCIEYLDIFSHALPQKPAR
jgi:hypothetical protein